MTKPRKRKTEAESVQESIQLLRDVMLANADAVKSQLDVTREAMMTSPEMVELEVLAKTFEESLRNNAAMFGQAFTGIDLSAQQKEKPE